MKKVRLQYGTEGLDVEIPGGAVTVLEPRYVPALPDEAAAFREALRKPIQARPLREVVRAADRVAVVIPDATRPLPSDRLLPRIFEELSHVPPGRFTIVVGTGSHRASTPEEIARMVGADTAARYRIVNHDAHDPSAIEPAGTAPDGHTVLMNREYVRADKRIALGFIEPHFMAGFSGGFKAVMPGVADIDSILRYHRAEVVADPRSTWGVIEGNPTQDLIRRYGSLLPLHFTANVTLNRDRRITGCFCGDPLEAHRAGAAFAKKTAMVACGAPFPIVVTSNGGSPLDQNLYQAVKGMSAAAQIVSEGGFILAAARCDDGFPSHGNFRKLLFEHGSPQAILDTVLRPEFRMFDQWEAQILAMILLKARTGLHSVIPPDEVRRAHMEPVPDIRACLEEELRRAGPEAPVAVLPEGPMTIPYLDR